MKFYALKPWSECRALIVNDDGIDARGIKALEALARGLFGEVVVVAPAHEHSGMAHAISYKKSFRINKRDETHYAVEGTPADCTVAEMYFAQVMNFLQTAPWPDHVVMNVNFPPVESVLRRLKPIGHAMRH